ncbi:rRNA-processing protein [Salix suchowensis]|nr:rRNA-processing protein [Salix suchowensis]
MGRPTRTLTFVMTTIDFDPEDIQQGLDPEDADEQADGSAAREHYIEVGPSTLRKLHDSISDPKYDGIRTSRKQLLEAVWDSLLDARIRLQKVATSSNKLPTALISSNTDVQIPPRKRRKVESSGTTADFDTWLKEATNDAVASESAQLRHPHSSIEPQCFSKNRQNLKSVVQLIDETLTTDRNKLLARTQVRRSKGARLGTANTERQVPEQGEDDGETIDRELFDDNDFYQQLLRDIIDARGDNAAGADDWMSAQKQKKSKKKVDTKASKGRSWHEEQIDELFASLLGKGFEQEVHASADDAMGDGLDSALADMGLGNSFRNKLTLLCEGDHFEYLDEIDVAR